MVGSALKKWIGKSDLLVRPKQVNDTYLIMSNFLRESTELHLKSKVKPHFEFLHLDP